jgi:hypothetical protein
MADFTVERGLSDVVSDADARSGFICGTIFMLWPWTRRTLRLMLTTDKGSAPIECIFEGDWDHVLSSRDLKIHDKILLSLEGVSVESPANQGRVLSKDKSKNALVYRNGFTLKHTPSSGTSKIYSTIQSQLISCSYYILIGPDAVQHRDQTPRLPPSRVKKTG